MSRREPNSVAVIGAGIVGLAAARQLVLERPGIRVTVLEKEDRVAAHQSGHNSGVVHAGVYYKPGSLKATLCRRGADLLRHYCDEHEVRFEALGKLVVASAPSEIDALNEIVQRATANGVPDLAQLDRRGIAEIEPYVEGIAALHSPHTAAVDYPGFCRALADEIEKAGGVIELSTQVESIRTQGNGVAIRTARGGRSFDQLIICAGLQTDRVARGLAGSDRLRIIPFRGEYFGLGARANHLVKGMVYPVPDPRYPFLGVHLTRDIDNNVHVGPNAVLALALEGYQRRDVSVRDLYEIARWPGTWHMAKEHWRHGMGELASSLSKRRYLGLVQKYLPQLRLEDLEHSFAGVRAQAIDRQGGLVDDFVVDKHDNILVVRNAPSPAATSSLAIAELIVAEALKQ